MSIIYPFSSSLLQKAPNAFEYVEGHWLENFVMYITNSNYRKVVGLESWIADQVQNPTKAVQDFADSIPVGVSNDETAINCLRAVVGKIKYISDSQRWNAGEYWATADETLSATTVFNGITYGPCEGDCEDGAILLYVVCRLKGIPANRLMLFAGNVIEGGHCWLGYKPDCYPLNFAFLDWCYLPDLGGVGQRNLYFIDGQTIHGETMSGDVYDRYKEIWFGFNEEKSTLTFKYNYFK